MLVRTMETNNNLEKLYKKYNQAPTEVEFTEMVDSRELHVCGYITDYKVRHNLHIIEFVRKHDGVGMHPRWIRVDKIKNLIIK